jgi:hypothetical protein
MPYYVLMLAMSVIVATVLVCAGVVLREGQLLHKNRQR